MIKKINDFLSQENLEKEENYDNLVLNEKDLTDFDFEKLLDTTQSKYLKKFNIKSGHHMNDKQRNDYLSYLNNIILKNYNNLIHLDEPKMGYYWMVPGYYSKINGKLIYDDGNIYTRSFLLK